ncbi:hypothetical protein GGX14DRAFT_394527 [Mycena pura]|uniref:Uncharacterized protein n=1 Tax=Mycena pura TaxID=153505 RepID=A0AAD6YDS1_9AGAR|nr:hypothetical protein GGX14DRAFT_394527 [Mycena pura]
MSCDFCQCCPGHGYLPRYGFGPEVEFKRLVERNVFLFRVHTPRASASLLDAPFTAREFDARHSVDAASPTPACDVRRGGAAHGLDEPLRVGLRIDILQLHVGRMGGAVAVPLWRQTRRRDCGHPCECGRGCVDNRCRDPALGSTCGKRTLANAAVRSPQRAVNVARSNQISPDLWDGRQMNEAMCPSTLGAFKRFLTPRVHKIHRTYSLMSSCSRKGWQAFAGVVAKQDPSEYGYLGLVREMRFNYITAPLVQRTSLIAPRASTIDSWTY